MSDETKSRKIGLKLGFYVLTFLDPRFYTAFRVRLNTDKWALALPSQGGIARFIEVVHMHSTDPAGSLAAVLQQLEEIWKDPRTRSFARRYAGDSDVADDALQSTYYAVARVNHLDRVENLPAYFCRVLIHEVHRERGQLRAALVEEFDRVAEDRHGAADCHRASPPSFQDAVCISLLGRSWLERLADEREGLVAAVPARSDDARRYRAVIYAVAEHVLRAGISGDVREADMNVAFRVSYPEYFQQPGAARNTCDQRFRRGRMDVRVLLRSVVSRDELR